MTPPANEIGIRAALWDIDGTLVDSLEMIVAGLGDSIERYSGVRPPDGEIRSLMGLPLSKQMRMYVPGDPDEAAVAEMERYTLERYKAHESLQRPFGAAIEALQVLHDKGLGTALVTSRNRDEIDHFRSRFVASDAVDVWVCASDTARPKPAPDPVLLACGRLAVQPTEAIMIGDSVFDLKSAQAAGVATAAVLYGAGKPEDLLTLEPTYVFQAPEDILSWAQTSDFSTYENQEDAIRR